MIETITFKDNAYPKFQQEGFAAKFAFPFALQVCKGLGVDIGYCKPEWKFPGCTGIDDRKLCSANGNEFPSPDRSPMNINVGEQYDFIFSSHCLEHLDHWVDALDHWFENLKRGGVMFLYLPDFSQEYWQPWNNRKHKHVLTPEIIGTYMATKCSHKLFVSGVDLNSSFIVMGEKN